MKQSEQTFNLETYKTHALGHYPSTIRRFGTTDSYSTQTVEFSCFRLLFLSKSYMCVGRTRTPSSQAVLRSNQP
jgi:hypothetical protein